MTSLGSATAIAAPSTVPLGAYSQYVGVSIGTATLISLTGGTTITVPTSGQIWPLTVQTS